MHTCIDPAAGAATHYGSLRATIGEVGHPLRQPDIDCPRAPGASILHIFSLFRLDRGNRYKSKVNIYFVHQHRPDLWDELVEWPYGHKYCCTTGDKRGEINVLA